ncbi:hypothetical protein CYJ76_01590 [Kytococcus schroeteri]|uniref:Uncharacterized protein n=1 Tax=Kytococcus schroeteri TaxID=138300 RepID=A0A2I1PD81_9MICO|nr:hypothetical protein CYJ76_01590 [Kytococcus schroeteri]
MVRRPLGDGAGGRPRGVGRGPGRPHAPHTGGAGAGFLTPRPTGQQPTGGTVMAKSVRNTRWSRSIVLLSALSQFS